MENVKHTHKKTGCKQCQVNGNRGIQI